MIHRPGISSLWATTGGHNGAGHNGAATTGPPTYRYLEGWRVTGHPTPTLVHLTIVRLARSPSDWAEASDPTRSTQEWHGGIGRRLWSMTRSVSITACSAVRPQGLPLRGGLRLGHVLRAPPGMDPGPTGGARRALRRGSCRLRGDVQKREKDMHRNLDSAVRIG